MTAVLQISYDRVRDAASLTIVGSEVARSSNHCDGRVVMHRDAGSLVVGLELFGVAAVAPAAINDWSSTARCMVGWVLASLARGAPHEPPILVDPHPSGGWVGRVVTFPATPGVAATADQAALYAAAQAVEWTAEWLVELVSSTS